MKTANFTNIKGIGVLLCSECSEVIKTEEQFNTMERYAYEGVVTLLPQFCREHEYMAMNGSEKAREKRKRGIKEKLREAMKKNILGVEVTRPNQVMIIMRGIPGAGEEV